MVLSNLSVVLKDLKKQIYLHIMALPGVIWLVVFAYLPLLGLVIVFQDYDFMKGYFHSPFVGLDQFKELFSDSIFWDALRNSVGMSVTKLAITFIIPIIFALMLNELKFLKIKRTIQTISYLPHFVSWVVVAGIFSLWLNDSGAINDALVKLNILKEPVTFLADPKKFWVIMAIMEGWKETGWWAIIYLAAIAGIPSEMFEAAFIDGASRVKQIFCIILPSIKSTIIILFILSVGGLIRGGVSGVTGSNFNQSLLFGNVLNRESSEIIDTYALRMGFQIGRFSLGSAASVVQSVLSVALFAAANWFSKKISDESVY